MPPSAHRPNTKPGPAGDVKYRRVLLKLSGEALMGEQGYGLDPAVVKRLAGEIKTVHAMGVQVALVIGGGNIFRGLAGAAAGMERSTADYMGMLATIINSLAMQSALEGDRRADAGAIRHRHAGGVRALYPPPRRAPHGEGPRRHLRRRHRQPVFHHRHRRGAARLGNPMRRR